MKISIEVKDATNGTASDEMKRILRDVAAGLLSIPFPPPKSRKPKWCQCAKCGKWHHHGT